MMRGSIIFLVRLALFLAVLVAVTEIWFRTVMPACETPLAFQSTPATICRYDPFRFTTGTVTVGRLCRKGGQWRINNAGWNSAIPYRHASADQHPLIALYGDSYIEGLYTNVTQHVDAYLARDMPGTRCYAFGFSGWYLEQYVAVARYARRMFQPDALVIFVEEGDVADSIRGNGVKSPYWWQIGGVAQSYRELPPSMQYIASQKTIAAKRSALIDYLRFNAELKIPGMRTEGAQQRPIPVASASGATSSDPEAASEQPWRNLLPAASFMVDALCRQQPGTPILFVGHGDRYLPPAVARNSTLAPLPADCRAVEEAAMQHPQCMFLDLRLAFSQDWALNHRRFEAVDGGHWNAYANELVARTIASFLESHRVLASE